MPFLPPNQQRQSTKATSITIIMIINLTARKPRSLSHLGALQDCATACCMHHCSFHTVLQSPLSHLSKTCQYDYNEITHCITCIQLSTYWRCYCVTAGTSQRWSIKSICNKSQTVTHVNNEQQNYEQMTENNRQDQQGAKRVYRLFAPLTVRPIDVSPRTRHFAP